MIAYWEKEINVRMRRIDMNLESILKDVKGNKNSFVLSDEFKTIRYISDEEYNESVYRYVEPNFLSTAASKTNPRFVIFSAPGATGKTALAQYICYSKNGIYWDLPDNKVAEYSLQGAIQKAVGAEYLSDFYKSITNGDNFLVIDAFDEAEAGSGRSGIEFFLRDLNAITKDCSHICAILMARTESALFMKKYFSDNNIPFIHYEVGYFSEYNAKNYIRNSLKRFNVNITDVVNSCIEAQFSEIKRILMNKDTESFLGYAPVLNALSASYDNDKNTLNLLKKINDSENSCNLLKKILNDLLERERTKFLKALKVKLPDVVFSSSVYDNNEQILRIFGKLAYDDETLFAPNIDSSIPIDDHEEYLDVVNTQLSQHPFIKNVNRSGSSIYDFTGTAFRDFVIAYCLSINDCKEFVSEYIKNCNKYCPSQLLIGFYSIFSDSNMDGTDIPLMYNSFKGYAHVGDKVAIHINGDKDDCSVEFTLERESVNILSLEFNINNFEKGIFVEQLSDCYIDIDGKVCIGNVKNESRIYNSVINCNEIVWKSEKISIEAYTPGECSLVVNSMNYATDTFPRFEVRTDENKNFKVFCPSLKGYYKLIPYQRNSLEEDNLNDFISFSNLIRRIFSCLRSHSKDAPARKIDFIDNRIISISEYKKNVLEFLINNGILYTDDQDWLYKLNTNKLSEYSIKWHDVRDGDFNSLEKLYKIYKVIDEDTP